MVYLGTEQWYNGLHGTECIEHLYFMLYGLDNFFFPDDNCKDGPLVS